MRTSATKSRKYLFKACSNCKYLVGRDESKCPNCGGETFTEDWRGVVLILDPERSLVSRHLNIRKEGKYALRLGM
ncbi:MAG: transcription elongation factor subunit Spt4 [Zestosphaera sp.]